ncbi:MAG: protein-L-isoaspartate O-methyltransferase [Patescibacteria group bacterium]
MTRPQLELKNYLAKQGLLKTNVLKEAFTKVDRKDFVLKENTLLAYEDFPIPIGFGQTISQPSTVAFMLDLLDIEPGQKILDVGSGSGWTTALVAKAVGPTGQVFAVEKIKELVNFGLHNLAKYKLKNISMEISGKKIGLPSEAPFDRILVSAAAEYLPNDLIKQLKTNGVMIIPIKNSVWKITRKSKTEILKQEFPGFMFVPLR